LLVRGEHDGYESSSGLWAWSGRRRRPHRRGYGTDRDGTAPRHRLRE
jgi:hypothetical protein